MQTQYARIRHCAADPNCEDCGGTGLVTVGQFDDLQEVACICTKYVDEDADFEEWRDSTL